MPPVGGQRRDSPTTNLIDMKCFTLLAIQALVRLALLRTCAVGISVSCQQEKSRLTRSIAAACETRLEWLIRRRPRSSLRLQCASLQFALDGQRAYWQND